MTKYVASSKTCPKCGGPKYRYSKTCRNCYSVSGKLNPNYKHGRSHKNHNYLDFIGLYLKSPRCGLCDEDEVAVLEVHHINRDTSDNSEDNLMLLCANCHKKEHYKESASKKLQKVEYIVKILSTEPELIIRKKFKRNYRKMCEIECPGCHEIREVREDGITTGFCNSCSKIRKAWEA